jgi:hypothetical protein
VREHDRACENLAQQLSRVIHPPPGGNKRSVSRQHRERPGAVAARATFYDRAGIEPTCDCGSRTGARHAVRVSCRRQIEVVQWTLDVSDAGWQYLKRATKVRDRLTHPKALSDLTVSDEEIRVCSAAPLWMTKQLSDYLRASRERTARRMAVIERDIAELEAQEQAERAQQQDEWKGPPSLPRTVS